jgi:hypothetical protein
MHARSRVTPEDALRVGPSDETLSDCTTLASARIACPPPRATLLRRNGTTGYLVYRIGCRSPIYIPVDIDARILPGLRLYVAPVKRGSRRKRLSDISRVLGRRQFLGLGKEDCCILCTCPVFHGLRFVRYAPSRSREVQRSLRRSA